MTTTMQKLMLAKIESVYRTDAAPTAGADAVKIENFAWSHVGRGKLEHRPLKNTLGPEKSVFGGALKQFTFDVRLKGSGAVDAAPEYGPLLRACRFDETVTPTTGPVVYARHSTAEESCTIWVYDGAYLHKATGCRGNVTGRVEAGVVTMLSFTMTGHFTDPTDSAIPLPSPTYDATVAPAALGLSFSVDGYSAKPSAFDFDCGNVVSMPSDLSEVNGYGEIEVTDLAVQGTITDKAQALSTYNWFTKWNTDAVGALTTGVIGATAGNRYTIAMASVGYRELSPGEIEGVLAHTVGYEAVESAGDDQLTITFT